jgi:toxin ParE1/3/4
MARIVVWTEAAADSLLKAAEYIAADSPAYAATLVSGADLTAQSLTDFPSRGRFVPEFNDQVTRELFVGSYRLIYRATEERILILAFIHGSRDLQALLGDKTQPSN